jgi:hypothetical protein
VLLPGLGLFSLATARRATIPHKWCVYSHIYSLVRLLKHVRGVSWSCRKSYIITSPPQPPARMAQKAHRVLTWMRVANNDLGLRLGSFGFFRAGGVPSRAARVFGTIAFLKSSSSHGNNAVMSPDASDTGLYGPECRLSWLCSIH